MASSGGTAKRLLLVSHRPLEYGGGGAVRWRFLREALPAHGWTVEIVTARPNITANEFAMDPRPARLRARVMGTVGMLTRPTARSLLGIQPEALAPSLFWSLSGRRRIRRAIQAHAPDVVWATGPPPAAMFAAARETERAAIPLVVEFRDLWAGNPYYDAGGNLLRRLEARPLAKAAAIVTVTPGARDRLGSLHPALRSRIRVLPNGFDPQLLDLRREPSGARPLSIVHAGAIYGDRSLHALFEALDESDLAARVRVVLIGPGAKVDRAVRASVEVLPSLPWEEAVAHVAAANVALVIRTPGDDTAVPGKAYEALALGKPILALVGADSELRRLLVSLGQERGCADADDPSAIAAALKSLLDDPPAPLSGEELRGYDRARIAGDLAALLDELTP